MPHAEQMRRASGLETELDMVVSTERVEGNGISKAENLDDLIEDTELIDAVVLD